MKFKYFDIHSHFNIDKYEGGIPAAIERMKEKEVGTICVGTDLETSKKAIEVAVKNNEIWATVGQHPTDTDEAFDVAEYERLASYSRVVAIGECGFDYFRTSKEAVFEKQSDIFKKQIELAQKVGKPLMIHARPSKGSMDAYQDTLALLKDFSQHVNFHFFVGDISIAKQIVERGWSMSFDGPITFSRDYDEVIKSIPIENIMAETDAPFAAPEPYRGKTCEPWMVEEVYKKIAEIKGLDSEKVRLELLTNAERVFGMDLAK